MEISGAGPIFLFGCLGGLAVELLRWWKLRESIEFPVYAHKGTYWFLTIVMIVAGGLIAIAYGTENRNALLAMNLGASTPAILGALATQPKTGASEKSFGGSAPGRNRLRNFIAFGR
jgi:predicted cobalt transporter CbtA